MVNIMNYKVYIYIATLLLSVFAFSGVNFDHIIRKNKALEARILVMLLAIGTSYLITNFITDFISVSSLIKG